MNMPQRGHRSNVSPPDSSQGKGPLKTSRYLFAWLAGVLIAWPGSGIAQNVPSFDLAPSGSGILGYQAAIDSTPGTLLFHVGTSTNINDGDVTSHVDNWSGGSDNGQGVSFVGIVWPATRYEQITTLNLTLATFVDGGWFGTNGVGPGAGGALTAAALVEPTVQISTNSGLSWTTVPHTSDYISALTGATIGGGDNPNPNPLAATFTLTPAVTNISGIRIIGTNGGNAGADPNGFLGVFELDVQATFADSDSDGMPDAWETAHGLNVGVNDAALDPDGDGLTNLQEYQFSTDPHKADTDGDGLTDSQEVNTYHTNPVVADTDGDGLSDGDEVNKYHTDPLIADTDGDGLSDGDEVTKYHSDPLKTDTDGDGYADGVEVALGSDPADPKSIPGNLALTGTPILGTEDKLGGTDTPLFNSGDATNINDGIFTSRVDTYNGGGTDTLSFVGIVWSQAPTNTIARLSLTLATFLDGGWFGPNNKGPGAGNALTSTYLTEPIVQVSKDGGLTWTNVAHVSDYIKALTGHPIGGGAVPNPSPVTASFILPNPVAGINGIRIIGTEGGTASGGFLGVFELQAFAFTDTDKDGMDDDWEKNHGLVVGTNDAALDPDGDGLTNLQEYLAGTDPHSADTDGDGLSDSDELNKYHTDPVNPDTDGDGLSDGDEVNLYHSNPLLADTDGDGFPDGLEVKLGTDPASASGMPSNLALRSDATAIIGTSDILGGTETPYGQAGVPANINDNDLTTHVDTFNGGQSTEGDTISYVGIVWTNNISIPIVSLQLTLATFQDGGWFGPNNQGPGPAGALAPSYLTEPTVQVSKDGGTTWTAAVDHSDYLTALNGATIGGGTNPSPKALTSNFTLTPALTNINGIRIIGTEGGTGSGGFLGVFELAVLTGASQGLTLSKATVSAGQFQFAIATQAGATHVVQYKNALTDATWQTLTTLAGDGTTKQVTDTLSSAHRFYRVANQ